MMVSPLASLRGGFHHASGCSWNGRPLCLDLASDDRSAVVPDNPDYAEPLLLRPPQSTPAPGPLPFPGQKTTPGCGLHVSCPPGPRSRGSPEKGNWGQLEEKIQRRVAELPKQIEERERKQREMIRIRAMSTVTYADGVSKPQDKRHAPLRRSAGSRRMTRPEQRTARLQFLMLCGVLAVILVLLWKSLP